MLIKSEISLQTSSAKSIMRLEKYFQRQKIKKYIEILFRELNVFELMARFRFLLFGYAILGFTLLKPASIWNSTQSFIVRLY